MIHTVGPVWSGGGRGEEDTLASAYRRSLEVAQEHGLSTISFPSISTGAYRFPADRAAGIALSTIVKFLKEHPGIKQVNLVLFGDRILKTYEKALAEIRP